MVRGSIQHGLCYDLESGAQYSLALSRLGDRPTLFFDRPVRIAFTLTLAGYANVCVKSVHWSSVKAVSVRSVNLGWREVRLPAPVFAGDTIRAETEVLSKRESQSRPGFGIVTVRTRGLNQRDEVVIDFERSILLPL
jgi:mesaconyl-CoA hydratase-like protein